MPRQSLDQDECNTLLSKMLAESIPSKPQRMDGLTEGRIVHFVLPDGPNKGEHRPAIIVKVWDVSSVCDGYCNLMVFMDGYNDGGASFLSWKTSKCYSEGKEPDTWHWIERS